MAQVSYIGAAKLAALLQKADPGITLSVWVESDSRLALGQDPLHPTILIDLSKEAITQYERTKISASELTASVAPEQTESPPLSRRSGKYTFELLGRRYELGSLRDLLRSALLEIEGVRPGSLEKLSHIKPRSKRIVALEKRLLFENAAMADQYGAKLGQGWWYGTNNSAQETGAWLERACSCAGLIWGVDFKTSVS